MKFKKFIENLFPDVDWSGFYSVSLPQQILFPGKTTDLNDILAWPPNIFLILYSLLEYTDKYRLIVSSQNELVWNSDSNSFVLTLSNQWKELISHQYGLDVATTHAEVLDEPSEKGREMLFLKELFSCVEEVFNLKNLDNCIYDLLELSNFTDAVFKLLLSVDELFSDVNICDREFSNHLNLLIAFRGIMLNSKNNLADNHTKHGFVTFKSSVPQSGLTINNLTQSLTCIKPAVKPMIVVNKLIKKTSSKKKYNILLLPWPLAIDGDSFFESAVDESVEMDPSFGFFDYKPSSEIKLHEFYSAIISAVRRVGNIDLIVFPECALSEKLFDKFRSSLFDIFGKNSPSLLAGVYGDHDSSGKSTGKNAAKMAFIGEAGNFDSFEQNKHHRWFLDKKQLRNYNLSCSLDPNKKWWEHIRVGRRNLLTLHTPDGVKLCPLICEDLARQEPVAQAVRAVGPNLVISLLLDGPQLSQRWPGKYAAVLSDDPGASVLSLTALGMALRSTGSGDSPSRGVALWSEPNKTPETLYLDKDGAGIIVELEMKDEKMWTIDGRVKFKPVLRKIFESSISIDISNSNPHALKTQLMKEINKGGVK